MVGGGQSSLGGTDVVGMGRHAGGVERQQIGRSHLGGQRLDVTGEFVHGHVGQAPVGVVQQNAALDTQYCGRRIQLVSP